MAPDRQEERGRDRWGRWRRPVHLVGMQVKQFQCDGLCVLMVVYEEEDPPERRRVEKLDIQWRAEERSGIAH